MEQFFLVFSAAVKVTVFTGKTSIAAFVKALRMQCMSNFPNYQGQHTEQNQRECEYIGKEDQKAVLEEGVPVVDPAFHAAVRSNEDGMKRAPAEYSKKYGKIGESKQEENPDPIKISVHIQIPGDGEKGKPEQHCASSTPVIAAFFREKYLR